MIIRTQLKINGKDYIHTKSDADRYIERDGFRLEESYDKAEFNREYTEGEPIIHEPDNLEIVEILTGGAE